MKIYYSNGKIENFEAEYYSCQDGIIKLFDARIQSIVLIPFKNVEFVEA